MAGYLDLLGSGIMRGMYGLAGGVGDVMSMMGLEAGDDISEYWEGKSQEYLPPEDLSIDVWNEPGQLADPRWWAYYGGALLPNLAASIIPGGAAMKGLRAAGAGARTARLGGAVAGSVPVSLIEGGGAYREAQALGLENPELRGLGAAAGIAGLNTIPLVRAFSPMGRLGIPGKIGATSLAEGLTEWAEEPYQALLLEQNPIERAKAGAAAMPLGMLGGAIMGGVTSAGDVMAERNKRFETEREARNLQLAEQVMYSRNTPEARAAFGQRIGQRILRGKLSRSKWREEAAKMAPTTAKNADVFYDEAMDMIDRGEIQLPKDKGLLDIPRQAPEDLTRMLEGQAAQGVIPGKNRERIELTRADGSAFVIGPPTTEDWKARVASLLTPKEIADAKNWYKSVRSAFRVFPTKERRRMIVAWLLSNQNVTPQQALTNALRVSEQVATGTQGLQGGLSDATLRELFSGQPVTGKGVGVKLYDFTDAALERKVRTIMGDTPLGGEPAVVDVHTGRDMGLIDGFMMNRLRREFTDEQLAGLQVDLPITVSGKGTKSEKVQIGAPSRVQYETAARRLRTLTQALNAEGYLGGNLTPSEVQAIGWVAMSKWMNGEDASMSPTQSIAQNTRQIMRPGGQPFAGTLFDDAVNRAGVITPRDSDGAVFASKEGALYAAAWAGLQGGHKKVSVINRVPQQDSTLANAIEVNIRGALPPGYKAALRQADPRINTVRLGKGGASLILRKPKGKSMNTWAKIIDKEIIPAVRTLNASLGGTFRLNQARVEARDIEAGRNGETYRRILGTLWPAARIPGMGTSEYGPPAPGPSPNERAGVGRTGGRAGTPGQARPLGREVAALYSVGTGRATPGRTVADVRESLASQFGAKNLAALEKAGGFKIIDDVNLLPEDVRGNMTFSHGVYIAEEDTSYLYAPNIVPGRELGILLHEVGVHQGLVGLMGQKGYRRIMDDLQGLLASGDRVALEAREQAEDVAEGALMEEETLAYIVSYQADKQTERAQGFVSRVLNAIRTGLYRLGIKMNLTPDMLVSLAKSATKHQARARQGVPYAPDTAPSYSRNDLMELANYPDYVRQTYFETEPENRVDARLKLRWLASNLKSTDHELETSAKYASPEWVKSATARRQTLYERIQELVGKYPQEKLPVDLPETPALYSRRKKGGPPTPFRGRVGKGKKGKGQHEPDPEQLVKMSPEERSHYGSTEQMINVDFVHVVNRIGEREYPHLIGEAVGPRQKVADIHRASQLLDRDEKWVKENIIDRKRDQPLSTAGVAAAMNVLEREGQHMGRIAKDYHAKKAAGTLTDEDRAAFQKQALYFAHIQAQVSGIRSDTARQLGILAHQERRMRMRNMPLTGEDLEQRLMLTGGREGLDEFADMLTEHYENGRAGKANKLVGEMAKPGFWDKLLEMWINGLLSGPTTHVVNMLSNALVAVNENIVRFLAAGVGTLTPGDRVTLTEAARLATHRVQGVIRGAGEAGKAILDETYDEALGLTKIESKHRQALKGPLGKFVRGPGRFLSAEDLFFKFTTYEAELAALATRAAKGDQALYRQLMNEPPGPMQAEAWKAAERATFTEKLGTFGVQLQGILMRHPYLRFIMPFIRTPLNIVKYAGRHSVLAPLVNDVRADLAAGGARRDMAITRMLWGSSMMAAAAYYASQGLVTGGGPEDPREREILYGQGWQPYSIKLGDKYYAYGRLEPLGMLFGIAADVREIARHATDGELDEVASLGLASIAKNLTSKTWLKGVSETIQAIHDPDRYAASWIRRFAGTAVPTGVAQVARAMDPELKRTESIIDQLKSRLPVKSRDVLPRLDLWGEPVQLEGGVGPDLLSPIYVRTTVQDPATDMLRELSDKADWRPGRLGNTIEGVELTPAMHNEYKATARGLTKRVLDQLARDRGFRSMPVEVQYRVVKSIFSRVNNSARKALMARHSDYFIEGLMALQEGGR